jgi:cobalt-zinc-cadmium efflux system protein
MHNHKEAAKNIKFAFILNLIFSIIEFIGGLYTNSVSIISDAIHDFGDSISILISYILEKISLKKPNSKYTYGYLRYSLVGALVSSLILFLGAFIIIYKSIPLLFKFHQVNSNAMLVLAIFGTIFNGIAAIKTSKGHSKNEKIISLHMLEDVLNWIAVLIGSIIIKFTGLYILDPILSIIISIYILYHAFRNLKDTISIFMDKVPDEINIDKLVKKILKDFDKIKDIHHVHIWSIDGNHNYFTAHIVLEKNVSEKEIILIKKELHSFLYDNSIHHSTLEIEYNSENCSFTNC